MDKAVMITIVVLAGISAVEVICLFFCSKLKTDILPIVAVIPVRSSDDLFPQRLEFLGELMMRNSRLFDFAVLVNYGASSTQDELCTEFCRSFPQAAYVTPDGLKTILADKYTAFSS